MKQVYQKIYKEYVNNLEIHYNFGPVCYEDINEADEEIISSTGTTDYYSFLEMVKNKECKSRDFRVITRHGKDILKRYWGWDESARYREKDFESYYSKTYISYCNDMSIDQLRTSLSAEQYIDWCKDHGLKNDNIKLAM